MAKFQIKSIASDEMKHEGGTVIGTGISAIFAVRDTIRKAKISNKDGGVFKYVTGLNEKDVKYSLYYRFLSEEEKKVIIDKLPDVRKRLEDFYRTEVLEETNSLFWDRMGEIEISNDTLDMYFDEAEPRSLLTKTLIEGGAFDVVAPSREAALATEARYYLTTIEEEAERQYEKRASKVEAYTLYSELQKTKSRDSLVYISWLLHPSIKGFTKKNAPHLMYEQIEDFIEGEYTPRAKKQAPARFVEIASRWKTDKENLILESCFVAAEHYGFLYVNPDTKKFHILENNFELGTTMEESKKILFDPRNRGVLLKLKEQVDEKLDK